MDFSLFDTLVLPPTEESARFLAENESSLKNHKVDFASQAGGKSGSGARAFKAAARLCRSIRYCLVDEDLPRLEEFAIAMFGEGAKAQEVELTSSLSHCPPPGYVQYMDDLFCYHVGAHTTLKHIRIEDVAQLKCQSLLNRLK